MIKYSLTGHTRDIGKCLYEKLSPNVIGFSKSTGYDITLKKDRERIIEESFNCDVFINNAQCEFGQVLLLIDLFYVWKDLPKTIINVGSKIADITLPKSKIDLLYYSAQKKSLKGVIDDMQGYKCQVKYKTFGYVSTPYVLQKYPHITEKDYISVNDAANIILG